MGCEIVISEIISHDSAQQMVIDSCDKKLFTQTALKLLEDIIKIMKSIERFNNHQYLDEWYLEISQTEDESTEFCITHHDLDIIAFLMADDLDYELEDVMDNFGLDSIYIHNYGEFLQNEDLIEKLLYELENWEEISDFHPTAIEHFKAVLELGFDLSPFGSSKESLVELTLDEEEIYASSVDGDDDDNADYNLSHDDFDPENVVSSIERGIQSWTDFETEDDDWDETLDDWDDDENFDETEWDSEDDEDIEWNPELDD